MHFLGKNKCITACICHVYIETVHALIKINIWELGLGGKTILWSIALSRKTTFETLFSKFRVDVDNISCAFRNQWLQTRTLLRRKGNSFPFIFQDGLYWELFLPFNSVR